MSSRQSRALKPDELFRVTISGLNHDGRGVGRINNKVMFIEGALPGEEVLVRPVRRRRKHNVGAVVEIIKPSADRVQPPCEYFGTCGGCSLQHLHSDAQISVKEKILAENLEHLGNVQPERWLSPITGPQWNYRRKARLGVRVVPKKGGVLVGFREKGCSYITSLKQCRILDQRFSEVLPALHDLIASLSCPDRIPQVEVAGGDNDAALIFRHLDPLTETDIDLLSDFGQQYKLQIFLQPEGPDSIYILWPKDPPPLSYRFTEFGIEYHFKATDFTQVNAEINQRMISSALEFLDIQKDEKVLDLFCGLGNFTLPIATRARSVMGIESDASLIEAAKTNAKRNNINNVEFRTANLYELDDELPWGGFHFSKMLLDPPRSGAREVLERLSHKRPERIVYISCNAATLARDAGILVNDKGYTLLKAGVMDMFPQTSHVESIAVFEK